MKMRLLFLSMCMVLVSYQPSFARQATCVLPKDCKFIESEFSTGGGSKNYIMEVTCKLPDGTLAKYLAWNASTAGLFGMGRVAAPRKIVFVPGDRDRLDCKY